MSRTDHLFENMIKARIMESFLILVIQLIESIIGLLKRPRDLLTPFMSGILRERAVWLVMMVTTAAKGLLLGNLATTVVLFSAGSLSVIVPPYLQWITEREKRRYQESYLLMVAERTTTDSTVEMSNTRIFQSHIDKCCDLAYFILICVCPEYHRLESLSRS